MIPFIKRRQRTYIDFIHIAFHGIAAGPTADNVNGIAVGDTLRVMDLNGWYAAVGPRARYGVVNVDRFPVPSRHQIGFATDHDEAGLVTGT